jgi:hypothetical protein
MKPSNPKDAISETKLPLWLLSPIAKAYWALAQFAGMAKYGAWNWRIAGVRASVYLSAMQRHLDAFMSGEEVDPVDGTHHLANIMACAAILLDAREAGKLTDDRPPSLNLRRSYAEQEQLVAKLREQYKDKTPKHYTIVDTVQPDPEPEPTVVFSKFADDYCAVCDDDFWQCDQTHLERARPRWGALPALDDEELFGNVLSEQHPARKKT